MKDVNRLDLAQDLLDAAREVIGDFQQWGAVLQTDTRGEYGEGSAIGKLMAAVEKIEEDIS